MKEFIGSQITDTRMKTIRIVVKFEVFDQRSGCGLECEMPDIGHLTFEGSPETLYGLVSERACLVPVRPTTTSP